MPSVRETIKKTPLYRVLDLARETVLFPGTIGFMHRYRSLPEDSVLLVGTPLHRNLGDHLIAEAEQQFLRDCFPEREIFEIPTRTFRRYAGGIKCHIPKDADVFITGGGWMGSLWPDDERILQDMVQTFSERRLVILPQTVWYDTEDESGERLLDSANEAFLNCRDLKLCTRDEASYKFAVHHMALTDDRIILAPDIALYYRSDVPDEEGMRRAGLYLRRDREQVLSEEMQKIIKHISERYETVSLDTIYPKPVGIPARKKRIRQVISDMKKCDIILTDRLHAMVFAVISGRKVIAADNRTRKVSGVAGKWLAWNTDVMILQPGKSFSEDKIDGFISSPMCGRDYIAELAPAFDNLKKTITKQGEYKWPSQRK